MRNNVRGFTTLLLGLYFSDEIHEIERGEGQSTLDLFGRVFVLLRFGAGPPDAAALVQAAADRGVPLRVCNVVNEAAEALYERRLVLVRPDGHVAWRGDRVPSDAMRVIDKMRGCGLS